MLTCDFFLSTNYYQSHVQSFGKVLKVFLICFCDSEDFISIILQGWVIWVYLDFVMNCCARIGNGCQVEAKMEMMLQEDAGIHPKQHKIHFPFMF